MQRISLHKVLAETYKTIEAERSFGLQQSREGRKKRLDFELVRLARRAVRLKIEHEIISELFKHFAKQTMTVRCN